MNIRRLRLLAIILPVGFWATVLVLRSVFFDETRSPIGDLFALGMAAVGATAFALWVFRVIADLIKREASARAETEATVGQMRALYEANLTLTTEHELRIVLQKVVDLARELAQAQYGALGVLTADGKYIEQFITSGINAEQRALLGEPPRGHGLLGLLITEGKPIRVPDIARDPRSVGFPPNHPPMRTLLGVPIRTKGNVIGDLYLTDKRQPADASVVVFTERDQQLLEMFAAQAAIAIENAQLYRRTQQLAVLQERERFGMDLHDGIIQSVYAIGLMLEDAQHRVAAEPQEATQRITQVIPLLNDVIRDIRNYILDLRPQRFQGRDVARGLEELARDLRANTFLTVNLDVDDSDYADLPPEQTIGILHVAQETLTNVRKHARATLVDVALRRVDGELILTIADNGTGFDSTNIPTARNGVQNMRKRASDMQGDFQIEPRAGGGTRVTLRLPNLTPTPPHSQLSPHSAPHDGDNRPARA